MRKRIVSVATAERLVRELVAETELRSRQAKAQGPDATVDTCAMFAAMVANRRITRAEADALELSVRYFVLGGAISRLLERSTSCLRNRLITRQDAKEDVRAYERLRDYLFNRGTENVRSATTHRIQKGEKTRQLVISLAKELKISNPRLSKQVVAQKISECNPPPCKYDQARKYLNRHFDAAQWRKLGNSER